MKPTTYISGPMRGHPHCNFKAFDQAKKFLTRLGFNVISPADTDRAMGYNPFKSMTKNAPTVEDCLRMDVESIIKADMMHVLPGFETSKGCKFEIAAAEFLDKSIHYLVKPKPVTEDIPEI